MTALQPLLEVRVAEIALTISESDELLSTGYSHSRNRLVGVIEVPVQLGIRNGLMVAQLGSRARRAFAGCHGMYRAQPSTELAALANTLLGSVGSLGGFHR